MAAGARSGVPGPRRRPDLIPGSAQSRLRRRVADQGIIHDFVMMHAPRETQATDAAIKQAIRFQRVRMVPARPRQLCRTVDSRSRRLTPAIRRGHADRSCGSGAAPAGRGPRYAASAKARSSEADSVSSPGASSPGRHRQNASCSCESVVHPVASTRKVCS